MEGLGFETPCDLWFSFKLPNPFGRTSPVVSDQTVMDGYESSATQTTDRLHYKLQTRPLVREGSIFRQKKGKSEIWLWAPKGCPTPRHTD
jgi:hypothetical protein